MAYKLLNSARDHMLKSVNFKNFRCYKDHTIFFPEKTLLVGKNNAGKSTCIEGLRLISFITEKASNYHIRRPDGWTGLSEKSYGISPSIGDFNIETETLFYNYNEPPAIIHAKFTNDVSIKLFIGSDGKTHALVYHGDKICKTRQELLNAKIPVVAILPQISPLSDNEKLLDESYVKKNTQSARSSLHFRNQLKIFSDQFSEFKSNVIDSWTSIKINDFEVPEVGDKEGKLRLLIRDADFVAEISFMGHGLQMWLQTIWFLTRSKNASTLILDEPDVYMHADIQRRLIRILINDRRQFIIATHSPEMLSEVNPSNIVILDRKQSQSNAVANSKNVQVILNQLGSVHNISIARLASHGKILLVEGNDVPTLKAFQNALNPLSKIPIDTIPNASIGGWNGWPSVVTMAKFFRKNTDEQVKICCILDRDYHTEEEIEKRKNEAKCEGIYLHIWEAKEIENYLMSSVLIARVLSDKLGKNVPTEEIESQMLKIIDSKRDSTFDMFSEFIRQGNARLGAKGSNEAARKIFNPIWNKTNGKYAVGGKEILSDLFAKIQEGYKISLSIPLLLANLKENDICNEIKELLKTIAKD